MSHDELTRRRFLQTTAAVAGAAIVGPLGTGAQSLAQTTSPGAAASVKRTATDQVTLGNTGIKLSRLGMGTGSENGRTQLALGKDEFVKLIHAAYDRGITFFDACDRYVSGPLMKDAIKGLPREKLYIQSKITGQPRDVLAAIDVERKKLDTDYFDSMMIHSQTVAGWTTMDTWKRIMDGFNDAKEKKWIRSNGVTCHNLPALQDATAHPWTEVHQVRVNPQGKYVDGPRGGGYVANETWPVDPVVTEIKSMAAKGRGIIGMKIMGNGLFTDPADREKSVRFAMSMKEIHAVVIGFKNVQEIDEAIERMNRALAEA